MAEAKSTFEPVSQYTETVLVMDEDRNVVEKERTVKVNPVTMMTFSVPDEDRAIEITSFPYTTSDSREIAFLRDNPLVKETVTEDPMPAATDAAMSRAEDLGIDIREVAPTGARGQATVDDVTDHARETGKAEDDS